ncbi:MAG: rRNA maturation RNase YbeY [Clostridia bacterium]|nr:rRNA maturation RNase YbeY [Clostridia bacterium]
MLFVENAQSKLEVTSELTETVERVCAYTLEAEKFGAPAEISVTFVDNDEIKRLNAQHRNIDSVTDVLSFPMLDYDEEAEAEIDPDTGEAVLGDIVISLERAAAQAEEYGHSFRREVAFLTAHSMLHLLGYDHMTPAEEKEMFSKQEKILSELGITRD